MPPRQRKKASKKRYSLIHKAAADGISTLVFVLGQAVCDETHIADFETQLSRALAPKFGLSPGGTVMALTVLLLLAMGILCSWLGGALFNPANNALMYVTGKGDLVEHASRVAGQCVGAVAGVSLAQALLPLQWQKGFSGFAVGLRPDVDIFEGAACEFVLGLLLAFVLLYSSDIDSRFWQLWLPLLATVLAVRAGSPYSGPSLNPAVTFGWEFMYQQQTRCEQLAVFWVAPVMAGVMGGWSYLGMKEFLSRKQAQKAKRD